MGLREKVALAIVFSVFTRIPAIKCKPRSHLNVNHSTINVKSPDICSIERTNEINTPAKEVSNLATINASVNIRFPEVEYPLTSQASEYYRFQNDYPPELPHFFSNSTSQVQNHKRQLKCKRKYAASAKTKTKPGPISQPHCTSGKLFPEVEYPLSARDVWLPTHRNPLQDAIINGQVEIDKAVATTPLKEKCSNDGIDSVDSKLSTSIKALNTEKQSISETFYSETNYSELLCPKESDGHSQINVNRSAIHNDINNESSIPTNDRYSQVDVILTTIMPNNDNNSVVSMPKNKECDNSVILKTGDDIIPKLGIAEENESSQDSIISIKSSATYPSVSPGDIVTSIRTPITTENSDKVVSPEPTIPEKNESSYDGNNPKSSEKYMLGNSDDNDDNVTTTTTSLKEPIDKISHLLIPEENQGPQHKMVLVSTNMSSCNIIPGPSNTSSLENGTDIVTPTSNFDISDVTLQVLVSKEDESSCDDTASKTTSEILRHIIPEQFKSSSLDNFDDILTAVTRIDSSTHQLNRNENESSFESTGSKVTTANVSDILTMFIKTTLLDDFKEIITMTTKTGIGETISQSPLSKTNQGSEDNKVSTLANMNNIDIIPELVETSSLDNCLDTITQVTNTKNSNIPLLFLSEEDQVSSDGIVSTVTAEVICKNISEQSNRNSYRDCDDIFTTVKSTDISNAVPQLLTAKESKESKNSTDYTVSKLSNVTNNDDQCSEPFKTNTSFGDYSNTDIFMINTKNNDTPELLFSKGCQENFTSTCKTAADGAIITETSNVSVVLKTPSPGNSTLPKPNIERLDVGDDILSHDIVDIDKNNFIEDETAHSTVPIAGTDKKTNPVELTLNSLNTISDSISLINTNTDTENTKVDATNCTSGLNMSQSTESSIETKNQHLRENLNTSTMLPKVTEYPGDGKFELYDAENLSQHLPVNNYETEYFMKESECNTNEESVGLLDDAIEFVQVPNSTLQNKDTETYISCN